MTRLLCPLRHFLQEGGVTKKKDKKSEKKKEKKERKKRKSRSKDKKKVPGAVWWVLQRGVARQLVR